MEQPISTHSYHASYLFSLPVPCSPLVRLGLMILSVSEGCMWQSKVIITFSGAWSVLKATNSLLKADFWHRIWLKAGSPSSGVLFLIKKNSKSLCKYAVRRLERRQLNIIVRKWLPLCFLLSQETSGLRLGMSTVANTRVLLLQLMVSQVIKILLTFLALSCNIS